LQQTTNVAPKVPDSDFTHAIDTDGAFAIDLDGGDGGAVAPHGVAGGYGKGARIVWFSIVGGGGRVGECGCWCCSRKRKRFLGKKVSWWWWCIRRVDGIESKRVVLV